MFPVLNSAGRTPAASDSLKIIDTGRWVDINFVVVPFSAPTAISYRVQGISWGLTVKEEFQFRLG